MPGPPLVQPRMRHCLWLAYTTNLGAVRWLDLGSPDAPEATSSQVKWQTAESMGWQERLVGDCSLAGDCSLVEDCSLAEGCNLTETEDCMLAVDCRLEEGSCSLGNRMMGCQLVLFEERPSRIGHLV